jgi:hypothetical protein
VRLGVRQHARPESISKRAPSATRTSLRVFRINNLRSMRSQGVDPRPRRRVTGSRAQRHAFQYSPRRARRICSGVWPTRLRKTFTKWEPSENPARRPISAVVTRSNSGDWSMRTARSTRA